MRVLFLVNRASGTGRAERIAETFVRACEGAGVSASLCDAHTLHLESGSQADTFHRYACLAVVGGDGSLHYHLGTLIAAERPVYHIPAGTENLFAREFGMTQEPAVFLRALESGLTRTVDTAKIEGHGQHQSERNRFVLMASFGPDAGVVHRLDEGRSRALGHAMYLRPMLREVLQPQLAHVRVCVDGREVVSGTKGMLVVANSRQYARRLDPARQANMTDGLLDVVFLPGPTTAKMLQWAARCAMGEQLTSADAVWIRGKAIEIIAQSTTPWQCDGEAGGLLEAGESLTVTVKPQSFSVLLPEV